MFGRINATIFGALFLTATSFFLFNPVSAQGKQSPRSAGHSTKPRDYSVNAIASAWINRQELQRSLVGLEIMELPSGRILFSHNGNKRLVPASTAKVLTTACIVDILGPNFSYITRLKATDWNPNGVTGTLIVEPSQDPSLTYSNMVELLQDAHKKGLRAANNGIEISTVEGGGERFVASWLCEDWGQDWMPPSSDLVIDSNVSGQNAPLSNHRIIIDDPRNAMMRTILASHIGAGWLVYEPDQHILRVYLSDPEQGKGAPLVVGNPDQFNLALVKTMAANLGIQIHGSSTTPGTTAASYVLAEHHSKPLAEIVKRCLHESDNLYAQQLLRTLGLATASSGDPKPKGKQDELTLEERGINRLAKWLSTIGVSEQEFVLKDGCGLSRKDCISPHVLNMVLKHMAGPAVKGTYLSLLKEGQVFSRHHGRFRFKTGAMDSVRAISGVLDTGSGKSLAVSVIVNGHGSHVANLRTSLGALTTSLVDVTIPPPAPQKLPLLPAGKKP